VAEEAAVAVPQVWAPVLVAAAVVLPQVWVPECFLKRQPVSPAPEAELPVRKAAEPFLRPGQGPQERVELPPAALDRFPYRRSRMRLRQQESAQTPDNVDVT